MQARRERPFFSRLRRWLPALFVMAAIFAFSSVPKDDMPMFGMWDLLVKKGGHMLGYAFLALAYRHALGGKNDRLAWALAVLYACMDEIHQRFVPGRGASVIDVGVDAVGAALALWWVTHRIPGRNPFPR